MPRIVGVDVPNNKPTWIALTYIHGIGKTTSKEILEKTKIDESTRVRDLTDADLAKLQSQINEMEIPVEGELRRITRQNIRRLMEIKSS